MTKTMVTFPWDSYSPFNIGMDDIFHRLESMSSRPTSVNYPPYNLLKHDNTNFEIEIALAGFSRDEIEVETETNVLKVASKEKTGAKEQVTYLHNGLSKRAFTNTWQLGDDVKVSNVSFTDGLLSVRLEKIIPDHQRKISYDISEALPPQHTYKKVLLTE